MVKFNIIVAATKDMIIGNNNELPWKSSKDMRFFKEKHLNH
jgi:dihydrofolate reductase